MCDNTGEKIFETVYGKPTSWAKKCMDACEGMDDPVEEVIRLKLRDSAMTHASIAIRKIMDVIE